MIVAAIGILTLMTVANLRYWRHVQARGLRWKLYALRDELRWHAIRDRRIVESPAFWTLDHVLTRDCAHIEELTLWHFIAAGFFWDKIGPQTKQSREALEQELKRPENAKLAQLYSESSKIFLLYFCQRHVVLFGVALFSIIGPFLLYGWFKRIAESLVIDQAKLGDHENGLPA